MHSEKKSPRLFFLFTKQQLISNGKITNLAWEYFGITIYILHNYLFLCKEPSSGRARVREEKSVIKIILPIEQLQFIAHQSSNITHTPRLPVGGYRNMVSNSEQGGINSRITVWMSAECHNNKSQLIQLMERSWVGAETASCRIPFALTKFKHLTPSGRCQQISLNPWPLTLCPASVHFWHSAESETDRTKKRRGNEKMPNRKKKKENNREKIHSILLAAEALKSKIKRKTRPDTKAKTEKAKNKSKKLTCSSSTIMRNIMIYFI